MTQGDKEKDVICFAATVIVLYLINSDLPPDSKHTPSIQIFIFPMNPYFRILYILSREPELGNVGILFWGCFHTVRVKDNYISRVGSPPFWFL